MDVILNSPLYCYLLISHITQVVVSFWQWLEWVPHYSWADYGSLLKSFIWLIPARIAYGVLFPERVVMKRVRRHVLFFRKSTVKPSKTDHQMAAAAINSLFHH